MTESKNRFQADTFLDNPVSLSMWQLLDRFPQLRIQLAHAMALSQPTKKVKKLAMPNLDGTATTVSKLWTLPAIKTIAHKDEEVICFYIDACDEDQKISKTFVDSDAVIELISQKIVQDHDFQVYHINKNRLYN